MSPASAFAKSSTPQSEIRTPHSNSSSPPSSAASPPSRSTPPSPSPDPQSPLRTPQSRPSLLLDFLTGEVPIEVILADHNLTPDQFLAWIESAETQRTLDTLARIDAARAKAIAATSRADALHSLRRVLVQSKSLGEIRRAASAILRYDAQANKPAPQAKPEVAADSPSELAAVPLSRSAATSSLTSPPSPPPITPSSTAGRRERPALEPNPTLATAA